jgi:hypothetical protein
MTIRNKSAYMDALWDWGFLDDCFAYGIKVSDIDGVVERNGHMLFIEAKPPKKKLSRGQLILFSNLARSGFCVMVLWGEPNKPECALIWPPYEMNPSDEFEVDKAAVHEIVRRWFVCVNQIPSKSKTDETGKWPTTLNLKPNGAGDVI